MTERRTRSLAIWLIVVAVLLLPAYVLSTGPIVWLCNHGYVPDGVMIVYWPLIKACHFEPIDDFFKSYLWLWREDLRRNAAPASP